MSSTYKVVLYRAEKRFELDLPFADGDQKNEIINLIEEWIQK